MNTTIDESEENPTLLWAEIWRLREVIKGPEGFETWQEAAVATRIENAKLREQLTAAKDYDRALVEGLVKDCESLRLRAEAAAPKPEMKP